MIMHHTLNIERNLPTDGRPISQDLEWNCGYFRNCGLVYNESEDQRKTDDEGCENLSRAPCVTDTSPSQPNDYKRRSDDDHDVASVSVGESRTFRSQIHE